MRVVPPIEITDARFTSSTVPEEVAATYAGGTTYAQGDLVGLVSSYGEPQTVWRSLQDGNTGNTLEEGAFWTEAGIVYPVYDSGSSAELGEIVTDLANHDLYESLIAANTGNALSDTTSWKFIGKTNRWRLTNYSRNNKTTVTGNFTVTWTPGKRINTVGLVGITGNSYSLSVTSVAGGGTVYTSSGSLNTRNTRTWYEYFFGEFGTEPALVFFDIPPYSDCIVTLTISATSGNAELGALVLGTFVSLGEIEISPRSDVLNFSTVERDEDGNAILEPRRNIPKINATVWCGRNDVDRIKQTRADLNAKPALWYGLSQVSDGYFEAVSMLGFYRNFVIDMATPLQAVLTIELEEV